MSDLTDHADVSFFSEALGLVTTKQMIALVDHWENYFGFGISPNYPEEDGSPENLSAMSLRATFLAGCYFCEFECNASRISLVSGGKKALVTSEVLMHAFIAMHPPEALLKMCLGDTVATLLQ